MSESLINTVFLAGAFLLLFVSAEIMYHKFNVKVEITRKYVHLITGLLTMLFPPLIGDHWLVLILCGTFFILLIISIIMQIMPSVNAVERVTRGSLLYPVIVYGCYLAFQHSGKFKFYYIPILTLAICDPIAALVGGKWPIRVYSILGHKKSLGGSSAFFISAFTICLFAFVLSKELPTIRIIQISFIVALATTIGEALLQKGYDNLSIPAAALLCLYLLI